MLVRQAVSWRAARSTVMVMAMLSGYASPAVAATVTTPMVVSATVLSLCTLVATPLVFGNYSGGGTLDATATISVLCTASTTFDIGLDQGSGPSATVSARKMTFGSASLNYALYRDVSRSVNWGNTAGTDTLAGVGSGLLQVVTVYGRIASGQYVLPGAYTDTITATITY